MWATITDVNSYPVTSSFDIEVYSSAMDYFQSADSTAVFAQHVDGNGVEGISCLTPGDAYLYLLQWSFEIEAYDTGASNPGYLLPPHIGITIDYCPNTGDFGTDSAQLSIDSQTIVWNSAEWAYNPPASFNQVFVLSGNLLMAISPLLGDGVPMVLAPRISVDDGAHQYQWGNVGFFMSRLGQMPVAA